MRATCALCGWTQTWTTQLAAQAAVTWHVYLAHKDAWRATIGDRIPQDARPWHYGAIVR